MDDWEKNLDNIFEEQRQFEKMQRQNTEEVMEARTKVHARADKFRGPIGSHLKY